MAVFFTDPASCGSAIRPSSRRWAVGNVGGVTLLLDGMTLKCPEGAAGEFTFAEYPGAPLRWRSGNIYGNLTINQNVTLDIEDRGNQRKLGLEGRLTRIENHGTLRFIPDPGGTDVAQITVWNNGGGNPTINNRPTGTIRIEGNDWPLLNYQFTAMPLNNEGRIVKTAGGGTAYLGKYWQLSNKNGGILESAEAAGTLLVATEVPWELQSGSILRGPGRLTFASGTVVGPAGTWTVDGAGQFLLDGAVLQGPQAGSLTLQPDSGTLTWRSGNVNGNFTLPQWPL